MSADLDRDTIRARADVLTSSGRHADALALLQEQARHHLDEPWLHADLAQLFLSLERYAEAERAARQSLALDPDGREALLLLGIAQQSQGRAAEARDSVAAAVAAYPDDDVAHRIAAAVYVRAEGEAERARGWAHIRRALELNPHDPEHYAVAVYANTAVDGPVSRSREYLEKGLALDPGHRALILASAALQESPSGSDPAALVSSLLATNPLDPEAHEALRGEFYRRLTSLAFIPWLQVLLFGFLATSLGKRGDGPVVGLILGVLFFAVAFVQQLLRARRMVPGQAGGRIENKQQAWRVAAVVAALAVAAAASRWMAPDAGTSAVIAVVLAGGLLAVALTRALLHLRRFPPGYAADLFRGNPRAWSGVAAVIAAFAGATAGTLWAGAGDGGGPGVFLLMAAVLPAAAAVHLLEGAERGTVPRWKGPGFEEYRVRRIRIGLRPVWYLICGAVLGVLPLASDPLGANQLAGAMAVAAGAFILARGAYLAALLLAAPQRPRSLGRALAIRMGGAGSRVLIPAGVFVTAALLVPLTLAALGTAVLLTGSGPSGWLGNVEFPQAPDFGQGRDIPDVPGLTPGPAPSWSVPSPTDSGS